METVLSGDPIGLRPPQPEERANLVLSAWPCPARGWVRERFIAARNPWSAHRVDRNLVPTGSREGEGRGVSSVGSARPRWRRAVPWKSGAHNPVTVDDDVVAATGVPSQSFVFR